MFRTLPLLLVLALMVGCTYGPKPASSPSAPPSPGVVEAPPVPAKIAIDSLDDLPAHSYPLTGTISNLLNDPVAFNELKANFRQDLETDLATYEITDEATLKGKYGILVTLDMLDGNQAEALVNLDKIQGLEDKEASRLMNGLTTRSVIEAQTAVGPDATTEAFQEAFRRALTARVEALPWDVVQDNVKSNKGRAEYLTENLLLGVIQSRMEPAAKAMGALSADLAGSVLGIRYTLDTILPLNPIVAEVYGNYITEHNKAKHNIWPDREVTLKADQNLQPVVIGIWDSGVDVGVFGDSMYTNPHEKLDGLDDDGNGFVDDVHGIAFDLDGNPSTAILHPLGDQAGNLAAMFESMQGFQDMTSAIDSPEASAVRKRLGELAPEKVGDFLTTLSFGGLYSHGTHVSGIASRGNPFAKLLVARITFDYHQTPQAMTVAIAQRLADDYRNTTRYFADHEVRIVNMSWGWSFKEIEGSLEANGVGKDAETRAAMAREMIGILSDGLHDAMVATPGILYVAAAGNDDNDVEFNVTIPSGFNLPNLMVVGAVDQAGDPTSFTSGGRNVKVYADGFQVESFVPGGKTMKMSGTSMASPNVCNLGAKLIALDPGLTPPEVISLIEKGADVHAEHDDIFLLNPKATVALIH